MKVLTQVPKFRIHLADQRQLLFPPPALDLLFSRDGITNVSERLKIDEPGDVIPLRKSLNDFAFVLYHSALQVAGHPGIEHAAGIAQNVDVIRAHFSFSVFFWLSSRA